MNNINTCLVQKEQKSRLQVKQRDLLELKSGISCCMRIILQYNSNNSLPKDICILI